MDRKAAGLILILIGMGTLAWYHRLARTDRELMFRRISGGEA